MIHCPSRAVATRVDVQISPHVATSGTNGCQLVLTIVLVRSSAASSALRPENGAVGVVVYLPRTATRMEADGTAAACALRPRRRHQSPSQRILVVLVKWILTMSASASRKVDHQIGRIAMACHRLHPHFPYSLYISRAKEACSMTGSRCGG